MLTITTFRGAIACHVFRYEETTGTTHNPHEISWYSGAKVYTKESTAGELARCIGQENHNQRVQCSTLCIGLPIKWQTPKCHTQKNSPYLG